MDSGYVGSANCAECHAEEFAKWQGSHHFHAMELPSPATVRADFNGSTHERYGVTSRFFREGEKYLVETENEKGAMGVFEVKYTFGWEPLQQYLVAFPDGRLQVLPTCWDVEKEEWYHIYPDEHIKPDDPLFWTRSMQNWDHMCADCHSTNLKKRFDPATRTFATIFKEMNVSCEACHGPGAKHVERARSGNGWANLPDHGLTDLNSTNTVQVEACAKCHARRGAVYPNHHAGARFLDHFLPEVTQPWTPGVAHPTYHVDGQIDDEVYVYGSFIQSKMYHKEVRCSDCHDMHTTRILAKGNLLCIRCHSPKPENLTIYDSPAHHFHEMGSKGAQCVECHMPDKTYMGIDARRDHSIRIPRPDLSVKYGTPNACNKCHDDQSASWVADWIVKWKGPHRPVDLRHPEAFHALRTGKPEAEKLLLATAQDVNASAFTRAGALLGLRSFLSDLSFSEARRNLEAADPVVRTAAVSQLEGLSPRLIKKDLFPMLKDPVRAVRTEAARVLSRLPSHEWTASERRSFRPVLAELKTRYHANLDRPEANLSLGILSENQEDPGAAEKHYRVAIQRESTFVPARMNLAMLLSRQGRNPEAEKLLREVIGLEPSWGQAYYSLGLLIAENPARLVEAADALRKATLLEKDFGRAHYNLGLCLWKLEKRDAAALEMGKASELEPNNPEYPWNIAQMYAQAKRWADALPYAEKAAQLSFGNPDAQIFLRIVRERASTQGNP
ncbi:MAG: tetratricopeptide repeat protein [Opitutales bacterium]